MNITQPFFLFSFHFTVKNQQLVNDVLPVQNILNWFVRKTNGIQNIPTRKFFNLNSKTKLSVKRQQQ